MLWTEWEVPLLKLETKQKDNNFNSDLLIFKRANRALALFYFPNFVTETYIPPLALPPYRLNFQDLYNQYSSLVYNLSIHYLFNTVDAEEATQDIFIKIHDGIHKFNQESTLKTWIYRITINHCLDILRARKRKEVFVDILNKLTFHNSHSTTIEYNHPGVILENKEATQRIMRFVSELPRHQQTAFVLKVIEGLSQKEIGAILDLSEKAVESLLSRARAHLKKKLTVTEG